MNREQLINEARAALAQYEGTRSTPRAERVNARDLAAVVRDMLAVFEEAHAPTATALEALLSELTAWQKHTGDTALANLLKRGQNLIASLSVALEAMTAEKEKWRIRCAEETIAWADEVAANRSEEAHAPTDDERLFLARIVCDAVYGEPGDLSRASDAVDRIVAAGFRRTVQGPPSWERIYEVVREAQDQGIGAAWIADRLTQEPRTVQGEPAERPSFDAFGEPRNRAAQELQAQGDLSDDEREALLKELAAWRRHTGDTALANLLGRAASALAAMTAAKEMWRIRCAEETIAWADEVAANRRTVQGEPSDAAVIAAMNALNGYDPPVTDISYWSGGYVYAMRAALRAAAEAEGGNR